MGLSFSSIGTTLIAVPLALSLVACSRTPQSTTERPAPPTTITKQRTALTPQQTQTESSSRPTLGSGPAESPPAEEVDKEVIALVGELRDQPWAKKLGCTPCASVGSKLTPEEAARRREIYDRLNDLGSAAVPALARILQSSLQRSDEDLTDTIVSILRSVSGPYTSRDGKRHEKNDISAALPALMLALDDPTARAWTATDIGVIGPKAAAAVPKLLAVLDEGVAGGSACIALSGIDPLPALR
jgi:hypothetical protein